MQVVYNNTIVMKIDEAIRVAAEAKREIHYIKITYQEMRELLDLVPELLRKSSTSFLNGKYTCIFRDLLVIEEGYE